MVRLVMVTLMLAISGCVIKPAEADRESYRLDAAGRALGYVTKRHIPTTRPNAPQLPPAPTWRDVLHRAFIANGELEASFHEWAMAVERIDQAGTWPTENVELGFDYMFSAERMKTFDRMTFSAGLMDASALPNKTYANASVAWRDAQAAGERFRAAKFDLQMRVLQAWADYALQAERLRIQEQNLSLLQLVSDTAASRVRAGGPQQDQLRANVQLRLAANELATAKASLDQQRTTLNALLQRDPNEALPPPPTLPVPRPIGASDEALAAAGVSNNPELAALGFEAKAREAAIQRARLEYLPEINPMAAFTGSVSQSLGAAITLPTQLPRIRGMIAEARADLRRVEALSRQTQFDRAGKFAATLIALRDAERRAAAFESEVLPSAQQTVELTRRGYGAGTATYLDVIDTQRTLLDVRLLAAEARTIRERMLAELEALAGMDVETVRSEE
ncbi:MAG TPA: TolC family protein [Tepidisphaeraceae bacterium]|nr:TolC family protein [Tepidisphaeraceae bacterium]